jgi:hypothetical protein
MSEEFYPLWKLLTDAGTQTRILETQLTLVPAHLHTSSVASLSSGTRHHKERLKSSRYGAVVPVVRTCKEIGGEQPRIATHTRARLLCLGRKVTAGLSGHHTL